MKNLLEAVAVSKKTASSKEAVWGSGRFIASLYFYKSFKNMRLN